MKKSLSVGFYVVVLMLCLHAMVSCLPSKDNGEADRWNERAYSFHFRDLDSVVVNAQRAFDVSLHYGDGKAEALNNMAFVNIAKMNYAKATEQLQQIAKITDNQIELMIADIQMMRICQRQSENKNFYRYREKAVSRLNRIEEADNSLSPHQHRRLVYAQSEYAITLSTYLYYVGQESKSAEAISAIDANGEIVKDTAQLLNYYYNVGAGGILHDVSPENVAQTEFDYLMRCYLLSRQYGYPYWEANSMQGISEHLQDKAGRELIFRNNPQEIEFLNVDAMPDSLLAGNLAQRALRLFVKYGDVYQTAGAYRTLAECYWSIADYPSALICLSSALSKNKAVEKAPDLVASIREQLSLVYSAMNDKRQSDYNRNLYLDIQENTRQDRMLEARAEQLSQSLNVLNIMIGGVGLMIVAVGTFLLRLGFMRRRRMKALSGEELLVPLDEWKKREAHKESAHEEECEQIEEQTAIARVQLDCNKQRNTEQRAKVSLVNSVMPLISRMAHEVDKLKAVNESADVRNSRYSYISELVAKITSCNAVLTRWIQMRQGDVRLHIESFRLQEIFDSLTQSRMEYSLKGIELYVEPSSEVVKADRTLTLFMINTIADNARKFTPNGGRVTVSSTDLGDCVEVSVADTGTGMSAVQLNRLFEHKAIVDVKGDEELTDEKERKGHGFGLMNCKGIIDKYRKMSSLFDKCMIGAESEEGRGSRIFFRLPKGVLRLVVALFVVVGTAFAEPVQAGGNAAARRIRVADGHKTVATPLASKAGTYADSAYFCNIDGRYIQTLVFADSCLQCINADFAKAHPADKRRLVLAGDNASVAAELEWFHDSVAIDYGIVLDVRNEVAVAALVMHDWKLYQYNNRVYTQLFRECGADNTLADYVRVMQKSESNKNVAIIVLVFLFVLIFPAYYLLYYRHRIYYNLCVDKIRKINAVILGSESDGEKLAEVNEVWTERDDIMVASEKFTQLRSIVSSLKEALADAATKSEERKRKLEMLNEELKKVRFENDQLYVSNNVLDNCLSTLKHETMYYPTRIAQLVDGKDGNIEALDELTHYYALLYSVFSEQAVRIVERHFSFDEGTLDYMFRLLKKVNSGIKPDVETMDAGGTYIVLRVRMKHLSLTDEQCRQLFTESTADLTFLLCRQIVRDLGEFTNARGCGIRAESAEDNTTIIEIKITKTIWKSSKLSS